MKTTLRFAPILIAAATLAHSQEELSSVESPLESEQAAALSIPITPHILGKIFDGTPPPPSPPKPEYFFSNKDVVATATHQQGGRTITIREIKPIALSTLKTKEAFKWVTDFFCRESSKEPWQLALRH